VSGNFFRVGVGDDFGLGLLGIGSGIPSYDWNQSGLAIIFPSFHIVRIYLVLLLLFHSCLTAPRIRL